MATLGKQAEPDRVVEPATPDVQRAAHASIVSANPTTFGTSAAIKFVSDDNSTTNYATPQGEKLLMDIQVEKGDQKPAQRRSTNQQTGNDDHVPEEEPIVDGNPKLKLASDVPGLVVVDGSLTADQDIPNIENIGGRPHESQEINGVPITPNLAAEVQSAVEKAGHSTGKGSLAARLQSAAGYNVREDVVPAEGKADVGDHRSTLDDKAAHKQSVVRIQHGAISRTPHIKL